MLKKGELVAGDMIKIKNTDSMLNGKYAVDKVMVSEGGYVYSIVISNGYWDIQQNGEDWNGRKRYDGYRDIGKIVIIKHEK